MSSMVFQTGHVQRLSNFGMDRVFPIDIGVLARFGALSTVSSVFWPGAGLFPPGLDFLWCREPLSEVTLGPPGGLGAVHERETVLALLDHLGTCNKERLVVRDGLRAALGEARDLPRGETRAGGVVFFEIVQGAQDPPVSVREVDHAALADLVKDLVGDPVVLGGCDDRLFTALQADRVAVSLFEPGVRGHEAQEVTPHTSTVADRVVVEREV